MNPSVNKNRIGKFTCDRSFVFGENFSAILGQMEFVPLNVIGVDYNGLYEFIGYSPLFDELEEYSVPPLYVITVHTLSEGGIDVEVERA